MKKLLKILMISVLSILSVFGLFACGEAPETKKEPGFKMYYSFENEYYVVSEYVSEGKDVLPIPAVWKGEPVGAIDSNAFKGNDDIKELIVPTSVVKIGESAFAGMKKLEKLTIPFVGKTANSDGYVYESDGATDKAVDVERTFGYMFGTDTFAGAVEIVGAYNGSGSKNYYLPITLKEVTIAPKDTYTIPMYAFSGNTLLRKVNLDDKIDKIGDYAFNGCQLLSDITIPETVTYIGKNAFYNAKSFRADLTVKALKVGDYAFYGSGLNSVTILSKDTLIGEHAFELSALNSVTINTVRIEHYAFMDCTNLQRVVIGDDVTTVGVYAFKGCKTLSSFGKVNTADYTIDLTGLNVMASSFKALANNKTYTVVSSIADAKLNDIFLDTTWTK